MNDQQEDSGDDLPPSNLSCQRFILVKHETIDRAYHKGMDDALVYLF